MSFSGGLVAAAVAGIVMVSAPPVRAEPAPRPGELVPVAGVRAQSGYSGDGGQATQARLGGEVDVAVAADGTTYIADTYNLAVRVVTPDGVITTLPTESDPDARLIVPEAVALDSAGTLYFATSSEVRRVNPDGTATIVAGGGIGDGSEAGPATDVNLGSLKDLAIGPDGSLYFVEAYYGRVRRVTPDGTLSTIAGDGVGGSVLDTPSNVAVDPSGNVYFTHAGFRGVQKIAPDGAISTVLGQNEQPGFSGDGGPAAEAGFDVAGALATDSDGNLYVVDVGNLVVRMIDTQGVIDTVGRSLASSDLAVGPNGDLYLTIEDQIMRLVRGTVETAGGEATRPGPARWADQEPGTVLPLVGAGRAMTPEEEYGGSGAMAAGPDGTVYYTRGEDQVVALRPDGTREVYAGSGTGFSGDGGPAVEAEFHRPDALAVDQEGNLYIADGFNFRVRKVDTSGTITTVAGKGGELSALDEGPNGDGGPATEASIIPAHLAVGPDGSLFVVDDYDNGRIRKIDPQGAITSVVGGGGRRLGEATTGVEVEFGGSMPTSVTVDEAGVVYFVVGDQIYRVGPGGELAALTAEGALNAPRGLAVGPDGTLYVADAHDNLVRAVDPDGALTTVAGNGVLADSGDGEAATDAGLREPDRVATDAAGNLYVTTDNTMRIRKVDTGGTISTVAEFGLVLDGVSATDLAVEAPESVAVDSTGTVFVATDNTVLAATTDDKVRPVMDVNYVSALATGPDGSVYLPHDGQVDRVYPDGATVTVAGVGAAMPGDGEVPDVDGRRATSTMLEPRDVAVSSAGELYLVSDTRVFRVDGDGLLRLVADLKDAEGYEEPEYLQLSIAIHGDEVYIADSFSDRVFAVNGDGAIRTFAGSGESTGNDSGDGDDATDAPVSSPSDIAVHSDGTVYIATLKGVRRVSTDGEIDTVVEPQDGESPTALALDVHGNLYYPVPELNRVFVIVRPGELAQPFPWSLLWWALAAVALGAVAYRVYLRRRNAPAEATP